uniref:Protein FAM89A n=2 Tax=Stomoxys calcitrans TaxID=35570 RepID=A0A1I8NYZ4_STOCA
MQDEEHSSNPDDDIDADNIEDADGDDGDDHHDIENVLKKSLKVMSAASQNSPRKRTPSGCSSDSSPYGTERSSRIRTSDWIEVGDNGKQVTLTSCHISLEDSGLEDEERMDEMSSSGVGDSWDSVKEAEQQQQLQQAKRSRSVKRIMSINDLPPLPKSLSGINKMLASDSGLISDVDTEMARNAKNNEFKQMENQKENSNNINNNHTNSNNNNNTNNNKDTTSDKISNSTALSSLAATTTTTAANAANASASVTETTSTTITTTAPLKEINGNETISEIPPAIPGSKLDNQIATLRKEMFGLRQLDLTLLSQLWALNDSIQEFRTMIQENEQEDDETYSTHSRSPSPYDSVSSDGDDEISALKEIAEQTNYNSSSSNNKLAYSRSTSSSGDTATSYNDQKSHLIKPPLPKPLDVKPVPRMRSAPPPPPTHRKSQNAPPRPT